MPKNNNIPKVVKVDTISVIRSKNKKLKDPVRFPKVIDPIEKDFTDNYVKMLNSMTKMLQIELLKQIK